MRSYWNVAMGVSFFTHSLLLAAGSLPAFNKNIILNEKKEIKEIKITVKELPKKEMSQSKLKNSQLNESKLPPPPYITNVVRRLMGEDKERPFLGKAQIIEKNTSKIIISEKLENSKLKSNPSYMSYYKGLRSKLNAACHKNYNGKEGGEVSVNFVLSRNGALESVKGEGDNKELIEVAVKSVKDSFPFLPFPPDLEAQSYQFDISIFFKNN